MIASIGRHSYCTNPIMMWEPDVRIGHFTAIAQPCTFLGAAQHPSVLHPELPANYCFSDVPFGIDNRIKYPRCGGETQITIGNDVFIGYDCTFQAKVTVGDGAIIGMKSVVVRDIPPYSVSVGVPCKPIKYRFTPEIIAKLLKIKWWDLPDDEIIDLIKKGVFNDINVFLRHWKHKL